MKRAVEDEEEKGESQSSSLIMEKSRRYSRDDFVKNNWNTNSAVFVCL